MDPLHEPDLIRAIQNGSTDREDALKRIFLDQRLRDVVSEAAVNAGADPDEVDPIFEECVIQLDRQIRRRSLTSSISDFFESATKQIWCGMLSEKAPLRERILSQLADDRLLKDRVVQAIVRYGGREEDGEDCFQNGLILLNEQLSQGKFRGGAIAGYFYRTCFNLWRNETRKGKTDSLGENHREPPERLDPQIVMENEERKAMLDTLFELLGESCRKILELKYMISEQLNMDEIAEKTGYKNAQNASNALAKCRKKLWELFQKHGMDYAWSKNT